MASAWLAPDSGCDQGGLSMSVPRGAGWHPFSHARASRPPNDGPVHAAGWRVLVTSPGGGSKRVTLTDSDATTALATVAVGVEVEILAWHPSAKGTRYRVRSTDGGVEGWVGAASLKSRPGPPSSAGTGAAAPSAHVKIPVRGPKDAAPQIRTPPLASRVATKVVRRAPRSAKK